MDRIKYYKYNESKYFDVESSTAIRYKINQLTDSGNSISLALVEDIELEAVTQQQLMLEAIDRAITDKDVKQQIKPILEAILTSQPQTLIKSYPQTVIQMTMPKRRYERIGSPLVGERVLIDIRGEK